MQSKRSSAVPSICLIGTLIILLSACSDVVAPEEDAPLRLLNYTAPATVGIGGQLVVRFAVDAQSPIERIVIDWRASETDEWHHIANAMAQDGQASFRHEDLRSDRMQLRIQPADRHMEVVSAWITIDRARTIQPITIVRPTMDEIFSRFHTNGNLIEWTLHPDFPTRQTRLSYRREIDSVWVHADTMDNAQVNRYIWQTPPREPGVYLLRLQALGYTQPTDPVRITITDTAGIRILAPVHGQVFHMNRSAGPFLRWQAESPEVAFTSIDVEYTMTGQVWLKLGTFPADMYEIPLTPTLSYGKSYRLRMRRTGGTVWTESGEFHLVKFHIALNNTGNHLLRGSPWEFDVDLAGSTFVPCMQLYLDFSITSDGGRSWVDVDIYGDMVTLRAGQGYMLRMAYTSGGITLADTTDPFSVTEDLTEFFPKLEKGTSFLFRNWNSRTAFGQPALTHEDTTEVEILAVTEEATRFTYSARRRKYGEQWTAFTVTEEKEGLHRIEGLPPGGPMYRYLDADLQTYRLFVRTNCASPYGYPRSYRVTEYERGIGVKRAGGGQTESQMSGTAYGCDFLRRWN